MLFWTHKFHWQDRCSSSLTHWGRVPHICVSKLTITGSDYGLPPGRRQAIIWNNAGMSLIRTWWTNFSEILCEIRTFSFKKMYLKIVVCEMVANIPRRQCDIRLGYRQNVVNSQLSLPLIGNGISVTDYSISRHLTNTWYHLVPLPTQYLLLTVLNGN